MKNNKIEVALQHLSKNDKVMSRIIKKISKCNLTAHRKYYQFLLKTIIGQQLSIYAAASIHKKFLGYFNNDPLPEKIVETEDEKLRSLGLSFAKIKYVKDLSLKIINKEISFQGFKNKTDEEITGELTKVKGIGLWTVHMFLIFCMGRLNILPVGDLGIKKAIMLNYGLKKMPDEKKIKKIAEKNNWSPYNSVAAWYMWRSLEMEPESI